LQVVDNATGGWGHINVDAFDTTVDVLGYEFDNAGFESGTLDGWTPDGEAFTAANVSTATATPGGEPFGAEGTYHLWGGAQEDDSLTGSLTSPRCLVGGRGEVRLLLSGTSDPDVYVAVHSATDDQE